MDQIRAEVAKWTPEEVERVTGIPGEQLKKVAETFAKQRPSTFIWCMGGTQHTVGTANVRAYCTLLLATGNVGSYGTGANIFRGHCNVQGATDIGLDITSLPLYYGLVEGAWKHWARVWEVDYDYFQSRFDEVPAKAGRPARTRKQNMELPGIPWTRWFDATLANPDDVDQRDSVKGVVIMGHGGNTVPRMTEMVKGLEKLELLVVADPHPTTFAAISTARMAPIAAGLHPVRDIGLAYGPEPLAAVGRADRQADLQTKDDYEIIYCFPRSSVSPTRCSRTSRWKTIIHPRKTCCGKSTVAASRPAIPPVARAPEGAYEEPGQVRPGDAARQGRRARMATITACRGRAGARPRSGIRARTLYNTNLHVKDGGVRSAPASAWCEEKQPDGSVKNVNLLAEGSTARARS
jgi:formate dehydrogenase major subunit